MQDNNYFGPTQTPTPAPGSAPMPNPAPAPNPYQPNPYQPTPAGAAPINPMGAPKKSHTGLIIGIIAGVVVIATVLIVLFAVVLPNANKGKDGDKKDNDSSKTADKDKGKTGTGTGTGTETGTGTGTGTGDGGNGGSTTTDGKAPTVVFNGASFTVGDTFGEVVRALNKLGYLYTEDDDNFTLSKVTDIESILSKVYDNEKDGAEKLPKLYFSTKDDKAVDSYIYISGWYSSYGNNTNKQKKYADLNVYITLNCDENETMTINGKNLQCGKTTVEEMSTLFPGGEKTDYGDYDYEDGRYMYNFDFYEGKFDEVLIDVMPE